jgi:hypothetical protein
LLFHKIDCGEHDAEGHIQTKRGGGGWRNRMKESKSSLVLFIKCSNAWEKIKLYLTLVEKLEGKRALEP